MNNWDYLPIATGYIGGILLVTSFCFQLYSIYQTKKVDNISIMFVLLQILVNIMFLTYNVYFESTPLVISGSTMSFLLLVMLWQKYYYTYIYKEPTPILPT